MGEFATLYQGDCLEQMANLPDKLIQTCVTSPPYFALRDYGVSGQVGLESTLEEYVDKIVEVFRGVRRILCDDGTVWLNLGDSYNSSGKGHSSSGQKPACVAGLKPKDLIGIPWRIAFALQADGWYLRQDIIWHKPNPMPESVHDRCTKAHEYIFLLSKSKKYYFDHEAIKEDAVGKGVGAQPRNTGNRKALRSDIESRHRSRITGGQSMQAVPDGKRNRRSVWTIPTRPFKGTHFAVFPPKLVEPCILAGCPVGQSVLDPFMGSGTVGMVARQHKRRFVGIELNPEYFEMAKARIASSEPVVDIR